MKTMRSIRNIREAPILCTGMCMIRTKLLCGARETSELRHAGEGTEHASRRGAKAVTHFHAIEHRNQDDHLHKGDCSAQHPRL